MPDFLLVMSIAAVAAVGAPLGGAIAMWARPTTVLISVSLGFAGGVLLGTISFKMLPEALQLSSPWMVVAGFCIGFVSVYALDLYVQRGQLAGSKSEQRTAVRRFHKRNPPLGDEATVLAGATSAEELIEGLSIGVGVALQPGLGLLIALAIVVDNFAEGLSIGELIRAKGHKLERKQTWRIVGWTGVIGAALFGSTLVGWFLLHGLPQPALGILLAIGGGGMFYLTITNLVPESEEHQYQQSAALAIAAGFLVSLVVAKLL